VDYVYGQTLEYNVRKNLKFSVVVGTAVKALQQAAEMKHELSAINLISTLAVLYT